MNDSVKSTKGGGRGELKLPSVEPSVKPSWRTGRMNCPMSGTSKFGYRRTTTAATKRNNEWRRCSRFNVTPTRLGSKKRESNGVRERGDWMTQGRLLGDWAQGLGPRLPR